MTLFDDDAISFSLLYLSFLCGGKALKDGLW